MADGSLINFQFENETSLEKAVTAYHVIFVYEIQVYF